MKFRGVYLFEMITSDINKLYEIFHVHNKPSYQLNREIYARPYYINNLKVTKL